MPSTQTAPSSERGGTYENEDSPTAIRRYRSDTTHALPKGRRSATTLGAAITCDIVVDETADESEHRRVSALHCRLEWRNRGLYLLDEDSKNGTYYETSRSFGPRLAAHFENGPVPPKGVQLAPGTTFVVGDLRHRYMVLDAAMQARIDDIVDILGSEDDARASTDAISPSDLILAAVSGGHLLLTGNGSGERELATIIHKMSKRRHRRLALQSGVPGELTAQSALLKDEAAKATLVLDLANNSQPIDPSFVSSLFSPTYQIRVLVIARTADDARAALGQAYAHSLQLIALPEFKDRRKHVSRFLDRRLETIGSVLRYADLTAENQRALRSNAESLEQVWEAADRMDAIVRAPNLSLNKARVELGVPRNTFYAWYGDTLRLSIPLVAKERADGLQAELAARAETATARS